MSGGRILRFAAFAILWSFLGVLACEYRALDSGHTMCIHYPKACPGKNLLRTGGITCQEKQGILETHNRLRQKVALGQIRGQPAALDMRELVWDDELATVAQRWADQCNAMHDRKRLLDRFPIVGQNVAATWTYEKPSPLGEVPEFKRQIEAWFNEVVQFGFRAQDIDPFAYSHPLGHYTQMVWSETYTVGCGYTYFKDPGVRGYTKLYVCNYGPGGNVIGATMYKPGRPGQSMCTSENVSSSRKYQGLCELSGVDYRDSYCAPEAAPAPQYNTYGNNAITAARGPSSPMGDAFKGVQSPVSGLLKLLNPYNIFG